MAPDDKHTASVWWVHRHGRGSQACVGGDGLDDGEAETFFDSTWEQHVVAAGFDDRGVVDDDSYTKRDRSRFPERSGVEQVRRCQEVVDHVMFAPFLVDEDARAFGRAGTPDD